MTTPTAATQAPRPELPGADVPLLAYYRAIERASDGMLVATLARDWDRLVRLEGACAVLISQLQHAARTGPRLEGEAAREKRRIMQHILGNDAQIRRLAEPWLDDLDRLLAAAPRATH